MLAAGALAQDVKTDYDHHAHFSQYHTYYWEKVKTTDPFWQNRIQDAVDHALQSKGWQRVDNGGDVALTAVGGTRNQQEYLFMTAWEAGAGEVWVKPPRRWKIIPLASGLLRCAQQATRLARCVQ
jgi:hypothetical protein